MPDFLPQREATLVGWLANFGQKISDWGESLGLSPEQLADYAQAYAVFAESYRLAHEPGTRTRPSLAGRDEAKAARLSIARQLAAIVRASPGLSVQQRADLQLRPVKQGRTRVARPATAPSVQVLATNGLRLTLLLRDLASAPSRRGIPEGVAGANVFSCAADQPPADPARWQLLAQTTRARLNVTLDAHRLSPVGKVWLAARWSNRRAEAGPFGTPVMLYAPLAGLAVAV